MGQTLLISNSPQELTAEFLNKYKIKFQIVLQRPGQLIYTKSNVYHQVINNNVNLCEAINVASPAWNLATLTFGFTSCLCADSVIMVIIPNLDSAQNVVRTSKLTVSAEGNALINTKLYTCDDCRTYHTDRKSNLISHMRNKHAKNTHPIPDYHTCSYCRAKVNLAHFIKHSQNCVSR